MGKEQVMMAALNDQKHFQPTALFSLLMNTL